MKMVKEIIEKIREDVEASKREIEEAEKLIELAEKAGIDVSEEVAELESLKKRIEDLEGALE